MDDRRVGAIVRAVRHQLGLRQTDVAGRARVSQASVSLLERGRIDRVSLMAARRIAESLDVRLTLHAWWRGGEAEKLLDRAHAALVDYVCGVLRATGWVVSVDYPFVGGFGRGSVDILAWHPATRAVCVFEIKTRLLDLQELLMTLARKLRIVPAQVREELGWDAGPLGRVVVVLGTSVNRSVVTEHPNIFRATFPQRSRAARAWIRRPKGDLAAVWFVSRNALSDGTHRKSGLRRIRRAREHEPGRVRATRAP